MSSRQLALRTDGPALALPAMVEETAPQAFVRRTALLVSVSLLAMLGWTSVAEIKEVAQARGMIVPAGFERIVQHYEGGIVSKILVKPGDTVEAGQTLFVLDDATTGEDLSVVSEQVRDGEAELEGLVALVEGRAPVLARFSEAAAKRAQASYAAMKAADDSQQGLLNSQVEQAKLMVDTVETQLKSLGDDMAFAQENFGRIEQLVRKGYATRAQLAERKKAMTDVANATALAQERREGAAEKLNETNRALTAYKAAFHQDLTSRIQQGRTRLQALHGDLAKIERRNRRLTVPAPVRGLVKSLEVTTIGGVVGSGQPLATIVPLNEELYAETKVSVSDVGQVAVGLPAHVKVTAFDFTRFGWIDGTITEISPSSFVAQTEEPYFKVRIKLASNHVPFSEEARVAPGMTVDADIVTGERTVLGYLVAPISKAFATAFQER